jgi:hypothetical protein
VNIFIPTATALAATAVGSNAVNAAQQSGGLFNQTMVPTYAPAFVFPTASAIPNTIPLSTTPMPMGTFDPTGVAFLPTITTTPPMTATPTASSNMAGGVIRAVGDRTFVLRSGVWIDTQYREDEMELTEIVFLSDEYFELLEQDERVGEFYALGERVIFVLDGEAYEVVPAE